MDTNINRSAAGRPTGGQFTGKTFTEADIVLLGEKLVAAANVGAEAEKLEQLARGKWIAAKILAVYPNATSVQLTESADPYSSWLAKAILDADDNVIADAWELGLDSEFRSLPAGVPYNITTDEDGLATSVDDPRFDWLVLGPRRSKSAVFDINGASKITGE
jgi:hypothetical protein